MFMVVFLETERILGKSLKPVCRTGKLTSRDAGKAGVPGSYSMKRNLFTTAGVTAMLLSFIVLTGCKDPNSGGDDGGAGGKTATITVMNMTGSTANTVRYAVPIIGVAVYDVLGKKWPVGNGTAGEFASESRITTWDTSKAVPIGGTGTAFTVGITDSDLVAGTLWVFVKYADGENYWTYAFIYDGGTYTLGFNYIPLRGYALIAATAEEQ
jgi:hypothetical protein